MSRRDHFDQGAQEHRDSPFEVVSPHRLVRIGGHNWPAVKTDEEDDAGEGGPNAHLPMENGMMVGVAHHPSEPQHRSVFSVWHLNPEGEHQGIELGYIHGADATNRYLKEVSEAPVHPEVRAMNQAWMKRIAPRSAR